MNWAPATSRMHRRCVWQPGGTGVRRAAISAYRSHARQQWEIAHWFRLLEPASGVSARPGHQGTGRAWPFRHMGPSIALDPKEQKSATLDRYYTQ